MRGASPVQASAFSIGIVQGRVDRLGWPFVILSGDAAWCQIANKKGCRIADNLTDLRPSRLAVRARTPETRPAAWGFRAGWLRERTDVLDGTLEAFPAVVARYT